MSSTLQINKVPVILEPRHAVDACTLGVYKRVVRNTREPLRRHQMWLDRADEHGQSQAGAYPQSSPEPEVAEKEVLEQSRLRAGLEATRAFERVERRRRPRKPRKPAPAKRSRSASKDVDAEPTLPNVRGLLWETGD